MFTDFYDGRSLVTEEDMRHLIAGLRYDAGDYAKHVEGKAEKGQVLEWDRQNVRSWDAANFIESMLVRTSDVSSTTGGA